jgi:hypothetical protein
MNKPRAIYQAFKSKSLSKSSAQNSLLYIIESNKNDNIRIEAIKFITEINPKHSEIFKLLENILISDPNEAVRFASFKAIKKRYTFNAKEPVKHAINNEKGEFLISLIDFLSELDAFCCQNTIVKLIRENNIKFSDLNIDINIIKKFSLNQLKIYFYNYLMLKSLKTLYFHRHHIPLALDFYGIDEF